MSLFNGFIFKARFKIFYITLVKFYKKCRYIMGLFLKQDLKYFILP